jgi:hypothetical protein
LEIKHCEEYLDYLQSILQYYKQCFHVYKVKSPLETLTESFPSGSIDEALTKSVPSSFIDDSLSSSIKRIYSEFIANDAPRQVALPQDMINKIDLAISHQNNSPGIFEPSFHYICNILKYNFYDEFTQLANSEPQIVAHEDNIPTVTLQQILNEETVSPYSYSEFLEFAKSEFGDENVSFLKNVLNYRRRFLKFFPDIAVELNAKLDRLGVVRPVITTTSSSRSSSNNSLNSFKDSRDRLADSKSILRSSQEKLTASMSSLSHQESNDSINKSLRSNQPNLLVHLSKQRGSAELIKPSSPLSSPLSLSPSKKDKVANGITKSSSFGNVKSATSPGSPSPSKKSGLIKKVLSRASSHSSVKMSNSSSRSSIVQPLADELSEPIRPVSVSQEDFEKILANMKCDFDNILSCFVNEDSPKQINLSVKQVNDLQEHSNKARVNPIVFNASYDHIYEMLRLNLLQKFLRKAFFASPNSRPFQNVANLSIKELILNELKSPFSLAGTHNLN